MKIKHNKTARRTAAHKHKLAKAMRRTAHVLKKKKNGRLASF